MALCSHSPIVRPILLAAAAGLAMTVSAHAQVRSWNGGSGTWTVPANWTAADVPDTTGESALFSAAGSYTATIPVTLNLGGLNITNSAARVDVAPGIELRMVTGGASNGLLVLNSTRANAGTILRCLSSITFSGPGTFRLNAHPGNLDSAYVVDNGGGQALIIDPGHTLAGTGRVYSNLVNNGLVSADNSGEVLQMYTLTKTNNAVMRAIAGGNLDFNNATINQAAAATLLADAGTLTFCSSTVNGGIISSQNGGSARNSCTSNYNAVTVAGPFSVDAGTEARLISSVTNTSVITVNPTAVNAGTNVRLLTSVALNGGGVLALNCIPGNLDAAIIVDNGGGQALTNVDNTIRGCGRIYSNFTNEALVSADVSGTTLQLYSLTKSNSATMQAVSGGNLDVSNTTLNQSGAGRLLASGGPVTICGSNINGGLLKSIGASRVTNTCSSNYTGVTTEGNFDVAASTEMRLISTHINRGTITLNPTSVNAGTLIRSLTNVTLTGGGDVLLAAISGNLDSAFIADNGGGQALTNADNMIHGTGRIYSNFVNDGLVVADVASRTLELYASTKTNRSMYRSINGSVLNISNLTLDQTTGPGQVQASGGTVQFTSSVIIGGSVTSSGVGGVAVNAASSEYREVTINGPFAVAPGTEMRLNTATGIINNGTVTVNPSAVNSSTLVRALSNTSILGNGQIVLNALPGNLDSAFFSDNGGGQVTTQGSQHTIRGVGRIYSGFVNNGVVNADNPAGTLQLNSATKTNNNLMVATAGGNLDFQSATVNQSPSAVIRSDPGSLTTLCSSLISGGTIRTMPGGTTRVRCNTHVTNATIEGEFRVDGGTELQTTTQGIINNGTITVNATATNAGTILRVLNNSGVSGSGAVVLNAFPGNLDSAYIGDNGGGQAFTNGQGHTVAGLGRFYCRFENSGIIAPGVGEGGVGRFEPRNVINCAATSDIRIDVTGPGTSSANFDTIASNSAVNLNGTLYARASSYSPGIGETFLIITGSTRTGTFSSVDTKGFRVDYLPNGVRLTAVCEPDVNEDGNVDQDDVNYLINVISGGDNPNGIDPDFNRDGNVDQDDISALINAVAGGGC